MKIESKDRERFWQAHLSAWKRSGLTQREYCKRQGLGEWSFSSWKRRLGKPGQAALSFVPARLVERTAADRGCGFKATNPIFLALVVDERYRIEIGESFSGETLSRLLAVLGRR